MQAGAIHRTKAISKRRNEAGARWFVGTRPHPRKMRRSPLIPRASNEFRVANLSRKFFHLSARCYRESLRVYRALRRDLKASPEGGYSPNIAI